MASHEDAIFDNNKYFFPGGTAKFREQAQAGLEVPAERDEQGTPGLQPLPNEQKFGYHDVQGLYGYYSAPLQAPAAYATEDVTIGLPPAQAAEHSQWSQEPATDDRNWQPPIAHDGHYLDQPVAPSQQQQQHQQQQQQQQQQQHLHPAPHQNNWGWSTTTVAPNQYPEQTYWAQPNASHGSVSAPTQWGQQSYTSLEAYSHSDARSSNHAVEESHLVPPLHSNQLTESGKPPRSSRQADARKRRYCIAGGVLGVLIIIGAVLGGVLGSGVIHSNPTGSATVLPPSGENKTFAPLKTIRQNSKLAVTGYRGGNGNYTLRLFFQGPDDHVRFMDKSSSDSAWTDPVMLDTLDYKPMPGGSIAAGSYQGVKPDQLEFFYLDTTSTIRGQVFNFWNDGKALKGQASSLDGWPLKVATNTSISCYFPYIVSQDEDDHIRWTWMMGQNKDNDSQPWWVNDTSMNVLGSKGTDLTLLPVAQTYAKNGGFIYRNQEGSVATAIKDYSDDGSATANVAWKKGSLSAHIPVDSAIGAFAAGRPYTSDDINTYILYQDEKGEIQVVWQEGDEWQGPTTHDALSNAAVGTDIECLTQAAWDNAQVKVSREQDMNRCFFQEKGTGRLKEVWYDGSEWKDQGFVPLD
ncbi:uncharacterized protein JN550_003399 [Neoarthrinium moseri]|uniref:uncharacterized protein n=1 Tax=Neoarthrinium moseri TaxID=1658444 RepID=UPI001FDB938B|nr:uncharacterized protein JN550_003399 [Neoarthrinium moseri]KAI1873146.1 hypothetical protein JN550_003399 [Neoarthrinium moseri]